MFKHGGKSSEEAGKKEVEDKIMASNIAKGEAASSEQVGAETPAFHGRNSVSGANEIKDLLEKNLKWSQIIYEQNRKINRKLTWAAVASWLKLLIILVPIVLGALFIPQLVKDYNCLFKGGACDVKSQANFDNLLKVLPLDEAQKEELKKIVK